MPDKISENTNFNDTAAESELIHENTSNETIPAEPQDIFSQSPEILRNFLFYLENIKARSEKTIGEYFLDLRTFFRYIK